MFKKPNSWLPLLAALLLICTPTGTIAAESPETRPNVAIVNGTPITTLDYDINLARLKQQYRQQGQELTEDTLKELESRVLDVLIGQELLFQDSRKSGYEAAEGEVEQQLAKFREQFPSEEAFQEALKSKDITLAMLTAKIEKGFVIQRFVEEKIVSKVAVPPDEVKAFYDANTKLFSRPETVKASHILIKLDENADDAQRAAADAKIQKVRQELDDGGDFADIAKRYSEGPSASNGGDLGFFQKNQMVAPFSEAAFALKKGEISKKVETRFGYHIIKLTDRKPGGTMALDEVKVRIGNHLRKIKSRQAVETHIEKLRAAAEIERLK